MTTANPLEGQTKSWLLTVPLEPGYKDVIEVAGKRENRQVANYIRTLVLQDLRAKGLVDENYMPLAVEHTNG
jgi:hypothetical protein